jgi:NADH-quinone oxidoreductase subunit M
VEIRELFASQQVGFPILSALIFLPIFSALVVATLPDARLARRASLAGALVELGLAIFVLASFVRGTPDVQLAERRAWIPTLGVTYHVGVDGLSVLFLPVTALLSSLVLVASWRSVKTRVPAFCAAVLGLEGAAMGIFSSLDLVLFFVFWEASIVPVYFLVSLWGVGPERRYAAMKFVLTMVVASGPLLLGIVLLGVEGRAGGAGSYTFDWLALRSRPISSGVGTAVFFLMLAGFAVKGPFFPLHTWMPSMLRECPAGVGVLLTGLKLGSYGVLRFLVPLLPEAVARHASLLGAVGALGVVYGALVSLVQPNLRRMLSFSCLNHVGFVLLGISSGSPEGLSGAVVAMLNLGLSATGLFFLTSFLQARVGSSEISALGGVAKRAPRLAAMFLLFGLASIGLPGTSGFVGEHLILFSTYRASLPLLVLALLGTVLGAAYVLRIFESAFLGPVERPRVAAMKDLAPEEWIVVGSLCVLVIAVGCYPRPVLEIVEASAAAFGRPGVGAAALP